jgi:hypothetical protein
MEEFFGTWLGVLGLAFDTVAEDIQRALIQNSTKMRNPLCL